MASCELIWLTGARLSMVHWDSNWPSVGDVWKYMIPAPYIRNAVELWLMVVFNEANNGNAQNVPVAVGLEDTTDSNRIAQKRTLRWRRFVTVHRRAMVEYHSKNVNVSKHVCRRKRNSILKGDRAKVMRRQILEVVTELVSRENADANASAQIVVQTLDSVLRTHHDSCGMTLSDLNNILAFHRQAAVGQPTDLPFFIAHDSQQKDVVAAMTRNGHGVQQSNDFHKQWSLVDALQWLNRSYGYEEWLADCQLQFRPFCATEGQMLEKEAVLFDMWVLYYADFFVGTWMSTLSNTACKWRGNDLSMNLSNQCALSEKWATTAQSLRDDKSLTLKNMWFSLENLTFTHTEP